MYQSAKFSKEILAEFSHANSWLTVQTAHLSSIEAVYSELCAWLLRLLRGDIVKVMRAHMNDRMNFHKSRFDRRPSLSASIISKANESFLDLSLLFGVEMNEEWEKKSVV